jgi:hypothetical protein
MVGLNAGTKEPDSGVKAIKTKTGAKYEVRNKNVSVGFQPTFPHLVHK